MASGENGDCVNSKGWKKDDAPTRVHSLILANGRRMDVNVHYDDEQWRLEEASSIDHLDELHLAFESAALPPPRSVLFELHIAPSTYKIPMEMFGGVARFRLGPMLATHLQRGAVFAQRRASEKPQLDNIYLLGTTTVRIRALSESVCDSLEFSGGVLTRGNSQPRSIPTEAFALHSAFFHRLFYGDAGGGRDDECVDIGDVTDDELDELTQVVFRPNVVATVVARDFGWQLRLAQLCGRYAMPHILRRVCGAVQGLLEKGPFEFANLKNLLEISDIAEKAGVENSLVRDFFGRFPLNECLADVHKEFATHFSSLSNRLLIERINEITRVMRERPKVKLHLGDDRYTVELFDDVYPGVESYLQTFSEGHVIPAPLVSSFDPLFFSSGSIEYLCVSEAECKLSVNPSHVVTGTRLGMVTSKWIKIEEQW